MKTGDVVTRRSWTGSRGVVLAVYEVKGEQVALIAWDARGFVPKCTAPCKTDDLKACK